MTTTPAPAPTVRTLLYGPDPDRATGAVAQTLRSARAPAAVGAVPGLSAVGRKAVRETVAGAVGRALDIDVADLLVAGWKRLSALREAARATIASPDSTEVVELVTHTMTAVERPEVEVLVNGAPFGRVETAITLELVLSGLLAVVRHGRLVEVRAGKATGVVRLAIQGATVAEREVSIDVPGVVRLGRGVELLGPEERTPPPGPRVPPPPPPLPGP